jgi:hypothetical protein
MSSAGISFYSHWIIVRLSYKNQNLEVMNHVIINWGYSEIVSYNCGGCRHHFNGYCKCRKIRVEIGDSCTYYEPPYEVKLPPDGRRRFAAVVAKKHVNYFIKSKRGSTDPELKELRKRLNLPRGFRLQKSRSNGSVYVKNAITKKIVRTISAEEVIRILNA